jgi:putative ABC transport system permease protein
MMLLAKFHSLISKTFRRSRMEAEITDELEFHMEARAKDLIKRGSTRDQAFRQARIEFGSVEKYKEEIRSSVGMCFFDELSADLRYGLRSLRRSPGFTLVATISLALGIGANTVIFSILDSILLKPLGYHDGGRLAVIWTVPTEHAEQTTTSSVSTYFVLRGHSSSFESLGAFNGGGCGVRSLGAERDGTPAERIFGQCFSPSLFDVLGVKPAMGRTFTNEEDQVGNVAAVAIISNGLWQRRFGSDPQILGKTITLNRVPTTIIGVLPADFELFKDPNSEATRGVQLDFIAPLELTPTQVQSRVGGLTIVGRLKPGVPVAQAQAEIDTITARIAASDPELHHGLGARVESFRRAAYRDYRSPLFILEGAVAFVLLIGCANVAGILLARGSHRHSEIVLRLALGAGRGRVVRQLMTESIPLALLGGIAGVCLSSAGLSLFTATAPQDFPRLEQVSIDGRVLAFTTVIVVLTSVMFSIIPAMQAAKVKLGDPLKESTRSATTSLGQQRLRSVLVSAQIGLALVLLIGAGLLVHSFVRVIQHDLGADPKNLLTFDFRLTQGETIKPFGRYRGMGLWDISPVPAQRFEQVLDRLQKVPGVSFVAAVNIPPFRGQVFSMPFMIEGRPSQPFFDGSGIGSIQSPQMANYFAITRGFFSVMKIPLSHGRDFNDRDTADAPLVMIINETMARQFFGNEDPIGQRITLDWVPNERPREIVGIVGDSASSPLQKQQAPAVYIPHLQQTSKFTGPYWGFRAGMYFVVRSAADPMTLVSAIKSAVGEVDPSTPVADIRTAEQTIDNQVRNLRLYMLLLGIFGAAAAVLAATGIYGVMAYSVAERTREIGIRMALGGRRGDIFRMVFRQAALIVGTGLALGLAGALALTRIFQSALFDATAADPITYMAALILLLLIAAIACLIPARRAVTVDPTVALKYE